MPVEIVKVRDWECSCGNKYTAAVELSEFTPNLSGEATQWCPRCGRKPLVGSAVREIKYETLLNNGD